MKRITKLEFVNYKAFYGEGKENEILIPNGKSVLLYGENGSGKSSIYEGIKQFFNSSDSTIEVIPTRHIWVSPNKIENEGQEDEREVLNEVAVKVTFKEGDNEEVKTFGRVENTVSGTPYVSQANLLNSFLSYRELLKTYLMDDLKDRSEFRLKFASLLIEVILAKNINSGKQKSYIKAWNELFIPRIWYKELNLNKFKIGLEQDISKINIILPEILQYFEKGLSAKLILSECKIEKYFNEKVKRWGKYPICEIDLEVKIFDEIIDDSEESHLTVLNEARLSSLALSIYLSSLIITPQDNFNLKILFLDDVFIGLDMSNRLPLLDILKNFKMPIIEQFVDPTTNLIVERILKVDGIKQTSVLPFFKDYQIFISTYDRFWFSVAKSWLETKSKDKWCFLELYANQKPDLAFKTPIIHNSLNYLEKAEYYYSIHEYPTCANYLRKQLEKRIKELLPLNKHYKEKFEEESGVTEVKKLQNLSQYLEGFISFCTENEIDVDELKELKNLKDWYFNPFSHDNIGTPIFKAEIDRAKLLVKKLDHFECEIILEAGSKLYFKFQHEDQNREYKVELIDNLRWVICEQGDVLTNSKIRCYEWIKNGEPEEVYWEDNLISFYNHKWRSLIKKKKSDSPDFPVETYWNEIYEKEIELPLMALKN